MKTDEFITLLANNKDKELVFEYSEGQLVGANYHITEVKHITIDSVDCGAQTDAWKETVIQLWESPKEVGKTNFMTAFKALGILSKVARMKPFSDEAEIRFEYGNDRFHTAQLYVRDVAQLNGSLLIKLSVAPVACKASQVCGVSEAETVPMASGCNPASGCC